VIHHNHFYSVPSLIITIIMVVFSSLVFDLSIITRSLASPTNFVKRDAEDSSPANFVLGRDNAVSRRQSTNFNQDYTTGGTVSYSPSGSLSQLIGIPRMILLSE
jgi:hypothetical protein